MKSRQINDEDIGFDPKANLPKKPSDLKGGSAILKAFKDRNQLVVKRNDFIQNTRFHLTANEMKLILHLIQLIRPDSKSLTFKLDVHEYAKFIGVKDNRVNVHRIKRDLKKLNSKSFWINRRLADGHPHEQLVQWFSLVDRDKVTGLFTLRFDNRLKPFLLNTKMFFTKYNFYYIMAMRSAYSIRLYEYFLSYFSIQNNVKGYNYPLNNILHALDLDRSKSYRHFYNLNRRILKPAVKEINKYSDMNIMVKPIKKGHKTVAINVLLSKKNRSSLYQTEDIIQKKLASHENY